MKSFLLRGLSLLLLGSNLISCGPPPAQQTERRPETPPQAASSSTASKAPASLSPGIPDLQPDCEMDQSPVLTSLEGQRMGNGGLFPYVYQGVGRSNLFEAYSMRFQLCYGPAFVPMTNDNTPWIDPEVYNENNGTFITYLRQGRPVSMSSPYILVQYVNKGLPMCSTADSIYQWIDQQHLKRPEAELFTEATEIQTAAGRPAICKEYQGAPVRTTGARRYLSYAYVDYNAEYFIGLALTTNGKQDFAANRALFYQMVRSLNYF
jgi:hypothetical protein